MTSPQSAAIVTTPHGSGLGTDAAPAFEAIKADLNQLWQKPGQIFFNSTGDITYAGASSALNSWLYMTQGIRGVASTGPSQTVSPFFLDISGDTVDTTTSGPSNLKGMFVQLVPSTNHTGGREAFEASIVINGAPATQAGFYTANSGIGDVKVNLGGVTGAFTSTLGSLFAANFNAQASNGATFIRQLTACEFDISVKTGASVADKFGITVNQTAVDTARGLYDDCGLCFPQNDAT